MYHFFFFYVFVAGDFLEEFLSPVSPPLYFFSGLRFLLAQCANWCDTIRCRSGTAFDARAVGHTGRRRFRGTLAARRWGGGGGRHPRLVPDDGRIHIPRAPSKVVPPQTVPAICFFVPTSATNVQPALRRPTAPTRRASSSTGVVISLYKEEKNRSLRRLPSLVQFSTGN